MSLGRRLPLTPRSRRAPEIALVLLALALAACGRSPEAGGGADSGVAGVGGSSGEGGLVGAAGADGGAGETGGAGDPPADISGRWGLFTFEDPVGVELSEAPDGTLGGYGCAAGAPGVHNPIAPLLGCGQISGKVTGQTATFGFYSTEFAFGYSVRVTISADARRMAGALTTSSAAVPYPIAWLRVPDDAVWLRGVAPAPNDDPLAGTYDLTLVAGDSIGDEFLPGTAYRLGYWDGSLAGHLGSFWNSEMSDPRQGTPLTAGPVVPTAPGLPISVALDFDDTGFSRVTARTVSGGVYVFAAARSMP